MEGIVKWYDRKKGYGFIQGDDGKDYFVHFTGIPQGTFIRQDDKVAFEAAEGEKGMQAKDIQLLQKGSERQTEETPTEEAPAEEEKAEEAPAEEEKQEEPVEEKKTEKKQKEE